MPKSNNIQQTAKNLKDQIPSLFVERSKKMIGKEEAQTFLESCFFPVKKSIRINTNLISAADFQKRTEKLGWKLSPIVWEPNGFFIDREDTTIPLGKTIEYFLGLFYVQEASSMLPATCLDVKKNDIVLDMAAAPGSKTTQLSCLMENQGMLVGNDPSLSRIKSLGGNVQRQGCANVGLTTLNGGEIGKFCPNVFDKILLDAPCSSEGTIHKTKGYFKTWKPQKILFTSGIQKHLIDSAFQALRVGGTLVYSTCTFAPEENEMVVDYLLKKFPHMLELEEIITPKTKPLFASGLTSWENINFSKDMKKAVHLFPHITHTGGFFVAKLKKIDGDRRQKVMDQNFLTNQKILRGREILFYDSFFKKRYGIMLQDWLKEKRMMLLQKENEVWIVPEKMEIIQRFMRLDRCGIKLCTIYEHDIKLSTLAARVLGMKATASIIEISDFKQIAALMAGQDITVEKSQCKNIEHKYVILKEPKGNVFGMGLLQENGKVKNQIPRYFMYAG